MCMTKQYRLLPAGFRETYKTKAQFQGKLAKLHVVLKAQLHMQRGLGVGEGGGGATFLT